MDFCPACSRVYQEHHEFCSADGQPLVAITPEHDPLIGVRFDDRYELVRMLGAGGNGVVYVARQVDLGRVVAFKMMYAERMKEERALRRFAREARALAALDHPGCVRVLDYRAGADSVPYLVMELIEGYPLLQAVGLDGLPPQHAVLVSLRVAEAVDAAHRAGIVHRDLKPENVILDVQQDELRIRLIDFGLAVVVDPTKRRQSRLTAEDRVVGTPEYMSPEQIKGHDPDGRSDLYALGVLLYELLTGVPPFSAPTASATLAMHLEDPAPTMPRLGLEGPLAAELRGLVARLLAKRPEDRPRDAQEVVTALETLLPRLPDAGPPSGIVERSRGRDPDVSSLDVTDTDVSVELERRDPFVRQEPTPAPSSTWTARRLAVALSIGALVSIAVGGLAALATYAPASSDVSDAPAPSPPSLPEPEPEGRVLVEEEATGDEPMPTSTLPTAGTVELPGGDAQAQYETALRSLGASLAQQGLRPRDIRSHPRGMLAWTAQTRAASGRDYAEAAARVGELAALAGSSSPREWMVYRLQRVEGALGQSGSASARARALWATLERSSSSPGGVRQWMQRVDALERERP